MNLRNLNAKEVEQELYRLRNRKARKQTVFKKWAVPQTKVRSVQGHWLPGTFAGDVTLAEPRQSEVSE
jgi:hypothetical protein